MNMKTNRQWILQAHPAGAVTPDCFSYQETSIPDQAPVSGMVLIRHDFIMCAPTVRNFISGRKGRFHPVVPIGSPVMAPAVGIVIASDNADWQVGDRVIGAGTWQDYAWIDPRQGYRKLPAEMASVDALGRFGLNARTAYGGLVHIGQPKAGERLLVSGAAGSVGMMVMQIGRILGCEVVGICGGGAKAQQLRGWGFAELIDYKTEDVPARIDALFPEGVDIFFDNVGGPLLADVIGRMRMHGRVVLCGQIATYDGGTGDPPLDMMRIIYGRLRLQGFIGSDFEDRAETILADLGRWYADGSLHHRADVRDGFARLPELLMALFEGSNSGTLVARIAGEDGAPL